MPLDSPGFIRGHAPTERPPDAPRRAPLAVLAHARPRPTPQALGEIFGVRWGRMQGWEVVSASVVQPPQSYVFDIGLIEAAGRVDLEPATTTVIGGLTEPATDGLYLRSKAGAVFSWVASTAAGAYTFDTGLTLTGSSVNLDPATPTEIGGLTEPATDGLFLRSRAGTVYTWQPAAAGTAYVWGTGLTEAPPGTINLDPAQPPGGEIGGLLEPPPDTGLQYTRSYTGGVGAWTAVTAGPPYTWGIGLDEVPPGSLNIDLLPATPTVIGGVSVVARSNVQGLALAASGALTQDPATDLLLGGILEPAPSDTILYARKRTVAGISTWEPVTAGAFVGDAPPPAPNTQGQFWYESDTGKLFIFFTDVNSSQWVQCGGP